MRTADGGQLAERYGYAMPFWGILGLLVVALLFTLARFGETRPSEPGQPVRYLGALQNLVTVFTAKGTRWLYLVNFLTYLAIFGCLRTLLMYMVDEWQMPLGRVTIYYSYMSVISAIANFWCVGPLTKRFSLKTLVVAIGVLSGLEMIAVVIPSAEEWLWLTLGLIAFTCVLNLSVTSALLSNCVADAEQGSVMGNNQALQVGGEALSAAAGGALAGIFVKLPLIVFGAISVGAALILVPFRPPKEAGS